MSKTEISLSGMNIIEPADWREVSEKQTADLKTAVCETLTGLYCRCNGEAIATESVRAIVDTRIKALAVSRRVEIGILELAGSRGVDIATASRAEITVSITAEEMNSLIAYEQIIPQATIEAVVTNIEMGVIQSEELSTQRSIRDKDWQKDVSGLISRASPHPIGYTEWIEDAEGIPKPLHLVKQERVKLDTIRVEVDNNGEVCAWLYEESEG